MQICFYNNQTSYSTAECIPNVSLTHTACNVNRVIDMSASEYGFFLSAWSFIENMSVGIHAQCETAFLCGGVVNNKAKIQQTSKLPTLGRFAVPFTAVTSQKGF